MKARIFWAVAIVVLIALAGWLVSCSSGSSITPNAQVSVRLSDPPSCKSDTGISNVWVAVSDVRIHRSASAGPNDSGWIDLTPSLSAAPIQVDLLSLGGNSCLLVALGDNTEIPAGSYQQIRLILAPNSATVQGTNHCSGVGTNNCIVVNGTTSALDLPSETTTGIKIPSGQIAGGAFTIAAGQMKDLVIDFDACASIVRRGGTFTLKPVLHAGEASLSSDAISGQLVDSGTLNPIANAHEIVALELKDANGIDRMIMQASPDANGNFTFCPVPAPPAGSSYDVVAIVETGSGNTAVAYAATITSGVQAGTDLGKIPMNAPVPANSLPGTITGIVSTAGASGAISEDLATSVLETMSIGGNNVQVTIPLTDPATQVQTTVLPQVTAPSGGGVNCPANTDCAQYTVALPATLPFVGTFSAGGTTYTQIPGANVNYTVDSQAFLAADGTTPTCSPSEKMTSLESDNVTPLAVTSGTTVTAQTLNFTGCL